MPPARQDALLELPLTSNGCSHGSVRLTQSGSRLFVAVYSGTTRLNRAPVLATASSDQIMERFRVPRDVADQLQAKLEALSGDDNQPAALPSERPLCRSICESPFVEPVDEPPVAASMPAADDDGDDLSSDDLSGPSATVFTSHDADDGVTVHRGPQHMVGQESYPQSWFSKKPRRLPPPGTAYSSTSTITATHEAELRCAIASRVGRMRKHANDVCTVCCPNSCRFHASCRYVRQTTLD